MKEIIFYLHVRDLSSVPAAIQFPIQFILPDDVHDGPVSAVGTFNDWKPGVHKLVRRTNGTRSVSISVSPGQVVRFRYLGSGGHWFDDPDAHEVCSDGSLLRI